MKPLFFVLFFLPLSLVALEEGQEPKPEVVETDSSSSQATSPTTSPVTSPFNSGEASSEGEAKSPSQDKSSPLTQEKASETPAGIDYKSLQRRRDKERRKRRLASERENPPEISKSQERLRDLLETIELKDPDSKEYKTASEFLNRLIYTDPDYELLKDLASIYEGRYDYENELRTLKSLTVHFPERSESFFLLGMAYKKAHDREDSLDKKVRKTRCIKQRVKCLGAKKADGSATKKKTSSNKQKQCAKQHKKCVKQNRLDSIVNLKKAIKIDPEYEEAYLAWFDWLTYHNPKTKEDIYNLEAVTIIESSKEKLSEKIYYKHLCKAYYDNKFLEKSLTTCARAAKLGKDPMSLFLMYLSKASGSEVERGVINTAKRYKDSFPIQYKAAIYFSNKSPDQAALYFDRAWRVKQKKGLNKKDLAFTKRIAAYLLKHKKETLLNDYYKEICFLTGGRSLHSYKKVKLQMSSRGLKDVVKDFDEGIKQCSKKVKEDKEKKPKKASPESQELEVVEKENELDLGSSLLS